MDFPHDCDQHHLEMPDDINIPFIPTPRSYGAEVLRRAINNIVDLDAPTSRQMALISDFLAEYRAADCDKMTYAEMNAFLETTMVAVDQYFFHGGLTQGAERQAVLRVYDEPLRHIWGHWTAPIPHLPGRITIFLRAKTTGARRPKIHLVTTLVHEMVHAYCGIFFNFCPEDNEGELVTGWEYDGHGILWQRIYEAVYTHMRTWDTSLEKLEQPVVDAASTWLDPLYYWCVQKLPWLRREWEVANLRPQEPADLLPPSWVWKPERKEQFKRALLRLSYVDYEHFVSTKVPFPVPVWQVTWGVGLVLIALWLAAAYGKS
ncbi:hypothetical protein F4824DRAFT_508625 [Ustulina deusta]|nr:hypothetical protein F4824DRAFT_508625 [Ustulina deusta]